MQEASFFNVSFKNCSDSFSKVLQALGNKPNLYPFKMRAKCCLSERLLCNKLLITFWVSQAKKYEN